MANDARPEDRDDMPTALVVDDSIFSRQIARRSLEKCGITHVTEANDGEEAIAYLATTRDQVKLIVCDLDMPTVDGIQFIRVLSGFEHTPPIVLLSSAPERT